MYSNRMTLFICSRAVIAALCIIAGLTFSAVTVNADESALKDAHAELLDDTSFSLDYVVPDLSSKRDPKGIRDTEKSGFTRSVTSGFGNVMRWLFYIGAAGLAGLIIVYIIKESLRLQRQKHPKAPAAHETAPAPAYQPDQSAAKALIGDIDALAATGRYDEAVHTLLLRSIEDMKANNPRIVARDLTSREISGLDILSRTAKTAFAGISARVERSLFGGRALSREDFEHCREAYQGFAFETNPRRRRR